jgi:hypothetical protein
LRRWLADQALTATLEHTFPDCGGRADLHVRVDPGEQSIEVQLSPLPLDTWEARTARYARHVDRVTWLFGPRAGQHLLNATVDQHGYALAVKLSSHEVDAADPATILIGTVTRSDTAWAPLTDCTMATSGISTPHVAAAITEHKQWQGKVSAAERSRVEDAARLDARTSGRGASNASRAHANSQRPVIVAATKPRGTAREATPRSPRRPVSEESGHASGAETAPPRAGAGGTLRPGPGSDDEPPNSTTSRPLRERPDRPRSSAAGRCVFPRMRRP